MNARTLIWPALLVLAGCGGGSGDEGRAPVADFDVSCNESVCEFDGSASSDPDGNAIGHQWQFGDNSTGRGENVVHAYMSSDSYEVTLTVTDSTGKTATATKEVTVAGNAAARYFSGIHDTFSILLFLNEMLGDVQAFGDRVQDEVEAHGNPADTGYTIECAAGGEIDVVAWDDANNSLSIDGTEFVEIRAEECRHATGAPEFTSVSAIRLHGDFDSDSFRYSTRNGSNGRLVADTYPDWGIQGEANFTTVRTGSDIDTIGFASENLFTVHVSSSGSVDLSVATPIELVRDHDALENISGEAELDFILFGLEYAAEIEAPVDFDTSGNSVEMTAGRIGFVFEDDRVFVSPNADPAYLTVEVDKDDDGDIDATARYPQSLALQRLISRT